MRPKHIWHPQPKGSNWSEIYGHVERSLNSTAVHGRYRMGWRSHTMVCSSYTPTHICGSPASSPRYDLRNTRETATARSRCLDRSLALG